MIGVSYIGDLGKVWCNSRLNKMRTSQYLPVSIFGSIERKWRRGYLYQYLILNACIVHVTTAQQTTSASVAKQQHQLVEAVATATATATATTMNDLNVIWCSAVATAASSSWVPWSCF